MPKALSPETIGQIEQMNAEGKTISQICEALSVSSATVTRVRNGKLKSPEAPTAMENASEDIKSIGNSDTNILADIVENVKQEPEYIPYSPYNSIVHEAVLVRMDRLNENIAELQLSISNYENELNALEEYHLKYMEAQNNERSNENC